MADLSQLLSNAADTKANFDFGSLNKSYWEGLDQAYKQRARDVFQDPSLYDASGNLNTDRASTAALKAAGVAGVEPAVNLSNLGYTQQQRGALLDYLGGAGQRSAVMSPPSISGTNTAPEKVQQDLTQGRQSTREPLQPPAASSPPPGGHTVMTYANASGIPNNQLGTVSESIANQLGVGPNDRIDTNDPQVRNVLVPAIQMQLKKMKDMGIGQTYAPGQATPPPQVIPPINPQQQALNVPPQPPPQTPIQPTQVQAVRPPPIADPTLGGLISPRLLQMGGGTPQGALAVIDDVVQRVPKDSRPALEAQAAAIRKQLEYTNEQKNAIGAGRTQRQQQEFDARTNEEKLAAATGKPVQEIMDRAEEAKANQAVLEKTMPVIVDSYKEASGAVNSIRATHQAREALDASGGILSGKWADAKLDALRIAGLVGADTSKIVNTETFNSQMAARLLEKVKSLPGPASDKDIKFLNGAVGSPILQEKTLRKMLDISEDADRRRIDTHNNLLGRASKSNDAIKNVQPTFGVESPNAYQRKLQEGQIIRNSKTGEVKQVKNGQIVDYK